MMNSEALPFELQELERLLNKTNSDMSGLASFFGAGEIWATRVPARLDVMGGIPGGHNTEFAPPRANIQTRHTPLE